MASEVAVVDSEVEREETSTDPRVEILPDLMTAPTPEAEVAREEPVPLAAAIAAVPAEVMPLRVPLNDRRELFQNYDL